MSVDGHVQAAAGDGQVALRELLRHGRHFHADACVGAARRANGGSHYLGKLGPRGLEPDGVGVGNVVPDDIEVLAGGVQAGQALLKTHGVLLLTRYEAGWCYTKALIWL